MTQASTPTIGVFAPAGAGGRGLVEFTRMAEAMGIPAVWSSSGVAPEAMPALAVAGSITSRVLLGTAVIQAYPRHPVVAANEAATVAGFAPGRFRLGLGTSHPSVMASLGIDFGHPIGRMREYLTVVQTLLTSGSVDFTGNHYRAQATLAGPVDLDVMLSALRPGMYGVAGELADAVITGWSPVEYVRTVGIPALRAGADRAGRPVPPVVLHVALCVDDDRDAVRDAMNARLPNLHLPLYQRLLHDAGYPEALTGIWSDALVDAVAVWGDEGRVTDGIAALAGIGVDELLFSVVATGDDPDASTDRALRLLAAVAAE